MQQLRFGFLQPFKTKKNVPIRANTFKTMVEQATIVEPYGPVIKLPSMILIASIIKKYSC